LCKYHIPFCVATLYELYKGCTGHLKIHRFVYFSLSLSSSVSSCTLACARRRYKDIPVRHRRRHDPAKSVMSPPLAIEVEGILYPPTKRTQTHETVRHACEEFEQTELDDLVREVVDIPVCVEHDATQVVGRVKCARRTASNAVWVTFTVDGRSEASRAAVQRVHDGNLCGISLSHDYVYKRTSTAGCSMDSVPLKGVVSRKGPIELSLCMDPARVGCNIHEVCVSLLVSVSTRLLLFALSTCVCRVLASTPLLSLGRTCSQIPLCSL